MLMAHFIRLRNTNSESIETLKSPISHLQIDRKVRYPPVFNQGRIEKQHPIRILTVRPTFILYIPKYIIGNERRGRSMYRITDDNRRRLEILKAFATFGEGYPTYQDIVNRSIEEFYVSAYVSYSVQRIHDQSLKERMEELLPQECRGSLGRIQIRWHRVKRRCRSSET